MLARKTVTDNMALALALLCLGVIGGKAAGSYVPRQGQPAEVDPSDAGKRTNVLLYESFEQGMALTAGEGDAPTAYGTPDQGGSGAYWGRTVARAANGFFSAWCAGDGWNSPSLPPYGANCIPYYGGPCVDPPYSNTTLTTGPFDLFPYASGTLRYDLWLNTEYSDWFSAEASVDGVNFYGFSYYGATSGFETRQVQLDSWPLLGNLMDHETVWFRFGYSSNGSAPMEGAFVDNVRIEVALGNAVFNDGFESGDTSGWWVAVP